LATDYDAHDYYDPNGYCFTSGATRILAST